MKILEPYTRYSSMYYEGKIVIKGANVSDSSGYYEAVQTPEGRIVIGCQFPDHVPLIPGQGKISFEASAEGGWILRHEGPITCRSVSIKMESNFDRTTSIIHPSRLRAKKIVSPELKYSKASFAITNLLWNAPNSAPPDEIIVDIQEGLHTSVRLAPVPQYRERGERLRASIGVEHTCNLELIGLEGTTSPLDSNVNLADTIVAILRLWSGNKIAWLFGEGLGNSGEPLERIHVSAVTGNFADTFESNGWHINLAQLIKESLLHPFNDIDARTIRDMINYYTECCDPHRYLEARALMAATLLDTLTLKYARVHSKDEVIPEADFKASVLPQLEDAVDQLPLDSMIKQELKDNVRGAFRATFRRRLRLLDTSLKLNMGKDLVDRVVNTRNSLVHEGRFPDGDRISWDTDYLCLLWTAFSGLCKLSGYTGELPQSPLAPGASAFTMVE